jgi:hypothetical protein
MRTRITLSFARLLQALLEGAVINAAEFSASHKKLLDHFIKDGVLDFRVIGKQQRKIFCPDDINLSQYLHHKFEIPSLGNYIQFLEKEDAQRSDAAKAVSNTKFNKTKVFTGFLLNCYEEINGELYSRPFSIKPTIGTFTFVSAYQHFRIPPDVTVVTVEGHENFREVERQRYLFEGLKPLFLWRYQNSNAIVEWLSLIPNTYIHFGDFDPKGIHIYLSEFKSKIPGDRGRFLIPPDLDRLLTEHGEKALYENQKDCLPLIRAFDYQEVLPVIEIIEKRKKGLAQEILIR